MHHHRSPHTKNRTNNEHQSERSKSERDQECLLRFLFLHRLQHRSMIERLARHAREDGRGWDSREARLDLLVGVGWMLLVLRIGVLELRLLRLRIRGRHYRRSPRWRARVERGGSRWRGRRRFRRVRGRLLLLRRLLQRRSSLRRRDFTQLLLRRRARR